MILYNAASSYYSMIARLALREAGVAFDSRPMDIHFAKEQLQPWYAAINPQMTVPALVDGETRLADSRAILGFVAARAGSAWRDADPAQAAAIADVVAAHYALSIERLTFGTLMLKAPPLRFLFPRLLKRINARLRAELPGAADPQAVRAKIAVNEGRLAFFAQDDLAAGVAAHRAAVAAFLAALPAPKPFLFGDRPSSADILAAVLWGRLEMIGEKTVLAGQARLQPWFAMMSARPAFRDADIWTRFHPLRLLLRR